DAPRDFGGLRLGGLGRGVAGEQQQAVIRHGIDAGGIAELLADLVFGLERDVLVFELRARRTAIGDDYRRSRRRAAHHQRRACRQRQGGGAEHCGQQQRSGNCLGVGHHSVSPRSRASIPSHMACSIRAWISWMRMVRSLGTHKWTSCAVKSSLITPPPLPVSAMTDISRSWAACTARTTFAELPLVDMATSRSPGWPRAPTWRS